MMISYLATATLAIGLLAATPQPPQWEPSYGKALKATRAGESPLLVVLDKPRTEEARIEPELLSEESVSGKEFELLRPYQLCHVDVSTDYGQEVAKAFRAESFPYVAIIDKTGSVVIFRTSGKIDAQEWEQALTVHKNGRRSEPPAIPHVSYKPSEAANSGSGSSCPNCQRNSF